MDEKKEIIYSCVTCNFTTKRKFNYECHLTTKRHNNNMGIIVDAKVEKNDNEIYDCKNCNYTTYKYSNYTKHLTTKKHILKEKIQLNVSDNKTECLKKTEEIFYEVVNCNKEMMNCNKQLMEVIQNGTNNIANINSNNNNNNNNSNTFNLNFFLNETCKDAINMNDFIESIEVSIMDLKKLGNKGYVEGISSLMIDKLNELDVTKRPIHSTDVKRNSIYIKDNDIWEKDEKEKMMGILWDVARKETRALENKYKVEYPKCETDRDSREHDEYWLIFYNAMGGKAGDITDLQKKVINKIVQNVAIDKTKMY